MAFVVATMAAVNFCLASEATRSPQAQEALARGFAMAQQQQWPLAIRYFRTAQSHAPTDGAVLFNLALAHDKAGGHDMVASAWYQAFLAAEPTAKSAPQVRKRLVDIEVASEIQIQRLLTTANQAVGQISDRAQAAPALDRIARAEAEAGDLVAAQRTVARIGDDSRASWALAQIAAAQAHGNSPARALAQARAVKVTSAQSWALAEIAIANAKRGDFAAALSTSGEITVDYEKAWTLSRICGLLARTGDIDGAAVLLERISSDKPGPRAVALATLAGARAKSNAPGAGETAKTMLVEAETIAESSSNIGERVGAFAQIARAYTEAGDVASVERILARVPEGPDLYRARHAVAEARGETNVAAIYRWSALAAGGEGNVQIIDIEGLLRSVQGQAPAQVVTALAQSAEERARFLRALRGSE